MSTEHNPQACQADSFEAAGTFLPRPVDLALRAREHVRRYGLAATFGKIFHFLLSSLRAAPSISLARSNGELDIPLGLQPGDCVEVRSESEIRATLDAYGKLKGLAFLPAMVPFCGKQFKVFKRMETMYQEESGKVLRLKNTVLLDGVYCDGLLMRCDRACFFFWREAWLRRVDSPRPPAN